MGGCGISVKNWKKNLMVQAYEIMFYTKKIRFLTVLCAFCLKVLKMSSIIFSNTSTWVEDAEFELEGDFGPVEKLC
jgi:hypothetical protein